MNDKGVMSTILVIDKTRESDATGPFLKRYLKYISAVPNYYNFA